MSKEETLFRQIAENLVDEHIKYIYESKQEFILSDEHERRMDKLFNKNNIFTVFFRVPKRVLAVIIICILLIATSFSVKAIREPVFKFFINLFKEEIHITFDGTSPVEQCPRIIEDEYYLEYIPEGYELKNRDLTEKSLTLTYSNEKDIFIFTQTVLATYDLFLPKDSTLINDSLLINGHKGILYLHKNRLCLLWNNDEYLLMLESKNGLSEEEMLKIARGALGGTYAKELHRKDAVSSDAAVPCFLNREEFKIVIPEDLIEFSTEKDNGILTITIKDKKNNPIILQINEDESSLTIYNTESDYSTYTVNTEISVFATTNYPQVYVWKDNKYFYQIVNYSDCTDPATILSIIESFYKN